MPSGLQHSPEQITMQVALPAALLGGAGVSDPKVKALYDELEVITKRFRPMIWAYHRKISAHPVQSQSMTGMELD